MLRIVRGFLENDIPAFETAVAECSAQQITASVQKLKQLNLTNKCLDTLVLQGTANKAREKIKQVMAWDPETDPKRRLEQIEGLPHTAEAAARAGRTSLSGPQCDTVLAAQQKDRGLAAIDALRGVQASCAEKDSVKSVVEDLADLAVEIAEKDAQRASDLAEVTAIATAFSAAKSACDLDSAKREAENAGALDIDLICLKASPDGARAAAAIEKLKTWPATIASTQAAMAKLPREILVAESLIDSCNLQEGVPAVDTARGTADKIAGVSQTCLDKVPEAGGLAAIEARASEMQSKVENFDKSSYEALVAKAEAQLQCSPQLALQTVEEARKLAHALFACTEFKQEPGRLNEIARRAEERKNSVGGESNGAAGELVAQLNEAINTADSSVTNCAVQAAHNALAKAASLKQQIEGLGPECVASVPDDSKIPGIRSRLSELEAKISDFRRGSYSSLIAQAKEQVTCRPAEAIASLTLAEKLAEALFACTDFNADPAERNNLMQQARSRQGSVPTSASVLSKISSLDGQVEALSQQGRSLSAKDSVTPPELSSLKRGIVRARASANTLNENSECFPEHRSAIAALLRRIDAIPIPGVRGGGVEQPVTTARQEPRIPPGGLVGGTNPGGMVAVGGNVGVGSPSFGDGPDTDIDLGGVAGPALDDIETAGAGGILGGTPAIGGPDLILPPAPNTANAGNTFGDAMSAGSAAIDRTRATTPPAWAGDPWRTRGGGYGGAETHPHPPSGSSYPTQPTSTGAPQFDCMGTCMQPYYLNAPRMKPEDRAEVRAGMENQCRKSCADIARQAPGVNTRGTTIIRPGQCIGSGCGRPQNNPPSPPRRGSGGGC